MLTNITHYGQLQLTFKDTVDAYDNNYTSYVAAAGVPVNDRYDIRAMYHWVFVPADMPAPDGKWGTSQANLEKVFNITDNRYDALVHTSAAVTITLHDGSQRLYDAYRITLAQPSKTFRLDI